MADNNARTPQSLSLPVGCLTCAIMPKDSTLAAPGRVKRGPPGAMCRVFTARSHVPVHSTGPPSRAGVHKGSTTMLVPGAKR